MKNILITGGCGYVGYNVVDLLLQDSSVSSVTVYDNLYRKNSSFFFGDKNVHAHKLDFINGDVLDGYTLEKALQKKDTVIHLAAKVSTPFSDATVHDFDQINNWGTAAVVSAVEKVGCIKRLIYVSSTSVYGHSQGQIVNESSIATPKTAYGQSKLRAEAHIARLSEKLTAIILRSGNVYGYNPCIRQDAVINRFMFDAQYLKSVEVHGDGKQKRAFIHVSSLANAIVKSCIMDHIEIPSPINVVEGNYAINEIISVIQQIFDDVEVLHLDQHLEMRSIASETIYKEVFDVGGGSLKDNLLSMKEQFRI